MAFIEVADRVWVARQEWYDVNVTLIGGEDGLVLVDTHASGAAMSAVLDDVRRLGVGSVTAVVNTHEHHDHTLGNSAVLAAYGPVPIHAHEHAAAQTVAAGERAQQDFRDRPDDPRTAEVLATEVRPADHPFSSVRVLDLGDRQVELIHPGRGHTAGDLVVLVPDAGVLLAGDLVEESAAASATSIAVPGFGPECFPLEWPLTLDVALGLVAPDAVIVPGHGAPVDRDFVEEQRTAIGVVAETARDAAMRGVRLDEALGAASWPYPPEDLVHAVSRVYEHLPRSQRRLPLV